MSSSIKQPQVITCKAAVAWGAGQTLVVEEVEVSPPEPEEIRIKVVCTSLCRSDITAWETQKIGQKSTSMRRRINPTRRGHVPTRGGHVHHP